MAIRNPLSNPGLMPVAAMLLTLAGGLHAPVANATTTDLSPTPPSITTTVDPNIVVSFDDSGSMLATSMPDAIQSLWYFDEKYYYSSTTNTVYYDPNKTYRPPLKPDGTSFPDSSYTHAWRDGMCANWPGTYCYGNVNYRNLSTQFHQDFNNVTSSTCTANSNRTRWRNTDDDNGGCGLTDHTIPESVRGSGYHGGFYYECPNVQDNTDCVKFEMNNASAAEKQNFANWYSYYRTRNLMARTAMARAFGALGENYRVAWQTINDIPLIAGDEIRRLEGDITDTNSWRYKFFTFLYDVHTAGSTPNRRATLRAGNFFMRGDTDDYKDPFWNEKTGADSARLTCRQNYQLLVTDGYWNYGNPVVPSVNSDFFDLQGTPTLGDGTTVFSHTENNKIHWNVPATPAGNCGGGEVDCYPSLSDIAFYYWGTDLQPLLANEVPPYLPDLSTDLFGAPVDPASDGDASNTSQADLLANQEIYWNPKNDPANWQHMVNFMVTLGIAGDRNWPGDYDALRNGSLAWPQPRRNAAEAADDTWHAAIVSRGEYFSASDPDNLVQQLVQILGNIGARTGSTTAGSLSSAVLTTGAYSYSARYQPATWSGDLIAQPIAEDGSLGPITWSAATEMEDLVAADRVVFTSAEATSGTLGGETFEWANLDTTEQTALSMNPSTGTADSNGSARVDWLRGDRSNEGTLFRSRTSVLGAIINSQPVFVAYPAYGYSNYFPSEGGVTAPEVAAFSDDAADCATNTPSTCDTYEAFAYNNADRKPVAYVGANDGMLHAIDVSVEENDGGTPADPSDDTVIPTANAGEELWSFVPRTVYPKLSSLTAKTGYKFRPTVDGEIAVRDVFYDGGWHSLLVGSLRLGGRGVYALDITDPELSSTSADAENLFMWEFNASSSGADAANPATDDNPANLGFTYGKPTIGRLHTGKWAVLVPGGYFPDCNATGAPVPCDDSMLAATNTFSSLFVLDAETGDLIRELRTPTGVSYGLATAVLGDYNSDQVADVAFAGDLVGNMWRFDLGSNDPAAWTVSQVFAPDVAEEQPITTMPHLFPDPISTGFMVVFGTGKYLGLEDRTNAIPTQYMYGIREMAADGSLVTRTRDPAVLVEQDLVEDNVGTTMVRGVTNEPVPASAGGWFIALDLPAAPGERVVATGSALFNTNRIIMPTLIPGGSDPCHPEREGAIMVLDALTGGSGQGLSVPAEPSGWAVGVNVVGARVDNPPVGGSLPVATQIGGGRLYLPGIVIDNGTGGTGSTFGIDDAIWRRRSWNALQ